MLVALDHDEEGTLDELTLSLLHYEPRLRTRILEVTKPRPEPFPASALPDNCLFHATQSDFLLHLDDDCILAPGTCELVIETLRADERNVLWLPTIFVDQAGNPLPGPRYQDWRLQLSSRWRRYQKVPWTKVIPPQPSVRTGACWALHTSLIRRIGGHDLAIMGYHNQDTILGDRLLAAGAQNLIPADTTALPLHRGPTWHMLHAHDQGAQNLCYSSRKPEPIANGGNDYWNSTWFDNAYKTVYDSLTKPAQPLQSNVSPGPGPGRKETSNDTN